MNLMSPARVIQTLKPTRKACVNEFMTDKYIMNGVDRPVVCQNTNIAINI